MHGPMVTAIIPIERHGVRRPTGPERLRALTTAARRQLTASRIDGIPIDRERIERIVGDLQMVADDNEAWRHPGGSLIALANGSTTIVRWAPVDLTEGVTVSRSLPAHVLLSAVHHAPAFNLLELALGTVRLRGSDNGTLVDLPMGDTPKSIDAALRFDDHERQLTNHTAGTGSGHDMVFHGHGVGAEVDAERIERFIRAVGRGVEATLQQERRDRFPLVVHAVAEHVPLLRSSIGLDTIIEPAIDGSPDDGSEIDLYEASRAIVIQHARHRDNEMLAHFRQRRGNGTTAEGPETCASAARNGTVDVLFITRTDHLCQLDVVGDHADLVDDDCDRAIIDTLTHGGDVVVVEAATIADGYECAALLRW